jgi:hypothetical protein
LGIASVSHEEISFFGIASVSHEEILNNNGL